MIHMITDNFKEDNFYMIRRCFNAIKVLVSSPSPLFTEGEDATICNGGSKTVVTRLNNVHARAKSVSLTELKEWIRDFSAFLTLFRHSYK